MNYQIFRLLRTDEADKVASGLAQRVFADGKSTATGLAREVKHNLQIERKGPELSETDRLLISALERNPEFQRFAIPRSIMLPQFSRYDPGMEYGSHIDLAIMGMAGGNPVRTDLAVTIFLNPPSSYEGGELVIEQNGGAEEIKLDAGEGIVYSASSVHHVAAVTQGSRLVAVTWVQSMVRDEQVRSILFDLSRATQQAHALGDRDLSLLLSKSYHNLLRHAAQP